MTDASFDKNVLPKSVYTAAQVRAFDRIAIDEYKIPGIQLMKRAGKAAFDYLLQRWPTFEHLHVFCGTGNNGGDGFIVAALAAQRTLPVTVWQVGDPTKIHGDALLAQQFAIQAGVRIKPFVDIDSFTGDELAQGVIVDALLGTGVDSDVKSSFAKAIAAINQSLLPVLALDVPSGLCSDSGRELGIAVRANATISFIALKRGLFTADAADCCGDIAFASLQIPVEIYAREKSACSRIELNDFAAELAPRPRTAHKGHYGHVLVIGGDYGMAGAVTMASEAAARVGAGLVSCATRPEHVAALITRCPAVMAHGVNGLGELAPLLERATAIVIGPGLGQSAWSEQMLFGVWQHVQLKPLPLLVDADALNLLAQGVIATSPHYEQWVLTPHPGEAARLLGCTAAEVQDDRFAAATALQQRYGGVVVLKGAGSLIASSEGISVVNCGNPGMATGGMGDVLSGITGGLLAQGLTIDRAATLGVCLHGHAADLAAQNGERGLLATDLLPHLQGLLNP
jgi:ADP-dependent NAD(P)H-hydrate dehydratase / NAD(P)H-hydrate epimerase